MLKPGGGYGFNLRLIEGLDLSALKYNERDGASDPSD